MIDLSHIIDEYLLNNFNIIFNFFNSNVYMSGGAIKDLILGDKIKDLDFIIISDNDNEIKKFMKHYNLKYKINKLNGYKIFYNNLQIDIWNSNNLYSCIQYNYDALFYNILTKQFISFGFLECLKLNKIIVINKCNNINEVSKIRKIKIKNKLERLIEISKTNNNL